MVFKLTLPVPDRLAQLNENEMKLALYNQTDSLGKPLSDVDPAAMTPEVISN